MLAYNANGGFNQEIAYKLPVRLRKFYFDRLIKIKEKEAGKTNSDPDVKSGNTPKVIKGRNMPNIIKKGNKSPSIQSKPPDK